MLLESIVLPLELRTKIYKDVFKGGHIGIGKKGRKFTLDVSMAQTGLLRTSKLIRSEALPLYEVALHIKKDVKIFSEQSIMLVIEMPEFFCDRATEIYDEGAHSPNILMAIFMLLPKLRLLTTGSLVAEAKESCIMARTVFHEHCQKKAIKDVSNFKSLDSRVLCHQLVMSDHCRSRKGFTLRIRVVRELSQIIRASLGELEADEFLAYRVRDIHTFSPQSTREIDRRPLPEWHGRLRADSSGVEERRNFYVGRSEIIVDYDTLQIVSDKWFSPWKVITQPVIVRA